MLFSGTLQSAGYILPFLSCLSLLFSAICKASSDYHFNFLHFLFFGVVLVTTSYTMLLTSVIILQALCLCCVLSHSVTSNSLKPQAAGLQPSRLLCPWGFSRQEYWSGLPCSSPGDLPNPGIKSRSPKLQVDSLLSEPPGKPTGSNPLNLFVTSTV